VIHAARYHSNLLHFENSFKEFKCLIAAHTSHAFLWFAFRIGFALFLLLNNYVMLNNFFLNNGRFRLKKSWVAADTSSAFLWLAVRVSLTFLLLLNNNVMFKKLIHYSRVLTHISNALLWRFAIIGFAIFVSEKFLIVSHNFLSLSFLVNDINNLSVYFIE
jgi:hypothetical protein